MAKNPATLTQIPIFTPDELLNDPEKIKELITKLRENRARFQESKISKTETEPVEDQFL